MVASRRNRELHAESRVSREDSQSTLTTEGSKRVNLHSFAICRPPAPQVQGICQAVAALPTNQLFDASGLLSNGGAV